MKNAYHTLTLVRAPESRVRESIRTWVETNKFVLRDGGQHADKIEAVYKGWHGFGITDRQTGTIMEILLKRTDDLTAVSIHPRTARILCIVGIMFGDRLRGEAESLVQHLHDMNEEER